MLILPLQSNSVNRGFGEECSFERHMTSNDWRQSITLVERKPGALRNGAPFATMPPPTLKFQRHLLTHPGGSRVILNVLATVVVDHYLSRDRLAATLRALG
jgi:hypothetical protein